MVRFSKITDVIRTIHGSGPRFRRHWNRLRARWRLHRIEWNGRLRPLEPPPGYEHYYSAEEMFPGLKASGPPPKDFRDWLYHMRGAFRLYKHHYFPDPEITRIEQTLFKENEVDVDQALQRLRTMVKDSTKDAHKYKRKVEQAVDNFTDNLQEKIKENRPAAEEVFKNRMDVLKASMVEFSTGYKEGVDGSLQWAKLFDADDDDDDDLDAFKSHPDNRPIRYEARQQSEQSERNPEKSLTSQ